MLKKHIFIIFLISCAFAYSTVFAGITGTLSGTVTDKKTGQILPGASVLVEGTTMGAMVNRNGHFIIYNLPAGDYDLNIEMIGYSQLNIKEVSINVDLTTNLDIQISAEVLSLKEVTITEENKLIKRDITSSTYFISGKEINDGLPIDSYLDAVAILPGVVGTHIRGGRETDVIYLLDGLPLQGVFSRALASYVPNNSITEMMVQTGGFSAEYGNASAGIINVTTKNGYNRPSGDFRFYGDFFDNELFQNDKTRRLEFNLGGPLILGLGGPLINAKYFFSGDMNYSDTQHKNQLSTHYSSPIFTNYNINSKISFEVSNNTILSFQAIASNWEWRQFDPQWALNPQGLAKRKHYSHRFSIGLTHTLSQNVFASIKAAQYRNKRRVLGEVIDGAPNLIFEDPKNPSSNIIDGTQPWNEKTIEETQLLKFDLVAQISEGHFFKTGIDIQNYILDSKNLNFNPTATFDGNSLVYNRIQDDFRYKPQYYSIYFEDQLKYKGLTANLGLRYDVFDPKADFEEENQGVKNAGNSINSRLFANESSKNKPLAPRLGISLPLSKDERLHLNYGWYYQMPSLYYLYVNSSANVEGYLPYVSNASIEPIKTISTEFSYKKIVSNDLLFVFTGFIKKYRNLIDTQTVLLSDSLRNNGLITQGYTRYINSAQGQTAGFEATLQKRLTHNLATRINYTYMKARGTSSSAEEDFNNAAKQSAENEIKQFPLSWDQRHSIVLNADYKTKSLDINILYRLLSPLPFTSPESEIPNSSRLSWRNLLDIRLKLKPSRFLNGKLTPFVEFRNLFDDDNTIEQIDNTGIQSYRLFDPISSEHGRRFRMGMILKF